jgi:glycosyltransferase involved in cell wall biosynthesis
MRVLLGVPWYFPDSVGGTEVYVRGLSRQLKDAGIQVAIAVPGATSDTYDVENVRVHRFAAGSVHGDIGLERDAPQSWLNVLDSFAPTILDLHSVTSALELPHLEAASDRGIRTVTTLHLAGAVCARGTFMRFGKAPCGGSLREEPCTACRLESQGMPASIARVIGSVPISLSQRGDSLVGVPAVVRRALAARWKDDLRSAWLERLGRVSDRLVVPSAWFADVLMRNDVPREKIVLCRQGADAVTEPRANGRPDGPLRVGFVGRYHPMKGLDILIDSLAHVPATTPLEVHVWGTARSPVERAYRATVVERARRHSGVVFHEEANAEGAIYRQLDVLAVPSLGLETGPLVVLEAHAAGLPVVGSNIGGIAERVRHGDDGLLIPPGNAAELARVLTLLATDRHTLTALRPKRPTRTVADVADDTLKTYMQLAPSRAA